MNALLIKYDRCLWFVILPYFPLFDFILIDVYMKTAIK